MYKPCFVASCDSLTRDRYCKTHQRQAIAWMKEERRLDDLEDARHPEASTWDWADWDWDAPFGGSASVTRPTGDGFKIRGTWHGSFEGDIEC
jgi:hypothetical protein